MEAPVMAEPEIVEEIPLAPVTTPIVPVAPPVQPEPEEEPAFEIPSPTPAEPELSLEPTEESVAAYLAQAVSGIMEAEPLTGTPQVPNSFFDDEAVSAPPVEPVPSSAPTYAKDTPGGAEEVEFYKLFDQDPADAPEAPSETVPDVFAEFVAPIVPPAVTPPVEPDARAAEKIDIARSISASLGDTEEIKVDIDAFWDDDGEPTTKRPKFNFDDLKFGANYDGE